MRRFREAFFSRSFYAVVLSIILALGVGVALAAITDDLKAHWKLNEASGTRSDSHASNDLTDNNTVTQATGKIGDAAQFTSANSEYLDIADNADLSTGDIDFSVAFWFYLDTQANMVFANKNTEWTARLQNTAGNWYAEFYIGDSGPGKVKATTAGSLSTVTWYFYYAYHDAAGNEIGISINDGTVDTVSTTGAPSDQATAFTMGSQAGGGGDFVNGRMDSFSFWKRKLTGTEVTDLYNGGSGFDYPFTTAAAKRSFGVIIYAIPAGFPIGGLW